MGRAMIDFGRFAQLCGHWAYLARQAGQDNRNMRAPPFRRDRAMASDTIAKLCSPADQSDSLVSVLRIF
jgi:hypothetical protein